MYSHILSLYIFPRTLAYSYVKRSCAEAVAYRECVGVLRLSVQWLHQGEVSSDPGGRHGENVGVAVQR